mmetsp:Transcript_95931/g.271549  ORF Transcript_95931/g.271549 Transcript_95931/m.271549 type:complete len:359 (-) Transcript_95931:84-1160(-)
MAAPLRRAVQRDGADLLRALPGYGRGEGGGRAGAAVPPARILVDTGVAAPGEGQARQVLAPGAQLPRVLLPVEQAEPYDEGRRHERDGDDLDEAVMALHGDLSARQRHALQDQDDQRGHEPHEESGDVGEVVYHRHGPEEQLEAGPDEELHQGAARARPRAPVLDELAQKGARQAHGGTGGTHADDVVGEDGAHDGREHPREHVDGADLGEAVDPLELLPDGEQDGHVQEVVQQPPVEVHAGHQPPGLALLHDLVPVLRAHLDEDLLAGAQHRVHGQGRGAEAPVQKRHVELAAALTRGQAQLRRDRIPVQLHGQGHAADGERQPGEQRPVAEMLADLDEGPALGVQERHGRHGILQA